ncbi:MAG: Rieske (2Fe-2S) protein [Fimbriimonadaceae bacterium]|nr:Rieske (2Fe-2S) protein [Fimbriimonadaceae bacterium]
MSEPTHGPQEPAVEPVVEPAGEPSRRTAIQAVTVAAGAVYVGALGYPVYRYLGTAADEALKDAAVKEVTLEVADLAPNSALMFKFAGRPALLIRHADETWTALSATCTHLACTVSYEPEKQRIYCACHGGVYDPKTGNNVSGPPPKPLKAYQAVYADGKVVVSRD